MSNERSNSEQSDLLTPEKMMINDDYIDKPAEYTKRDTIRHFERMQKNAL